VHTIKIGDGGGREKEMCGGAGGDLTFGGQKRTLGKQGKTFGKNRKIRCGDSVSLG
jgi:hypothetical protein